MTDKISGTAALEACGFERWRVTEGAEWWTYTGAASRPGDISFELLDGEYVVYAEDEAGEPLPISPDLADAMLARLYELKAQL